MSKIPFHKDIAYVNYSIDEEFIGTLNGSDAYDLFEEI